MTKITPIFLILALITSGACSQITNKYYFTNPYKNTQSPHKSFNGIRFSLTIADDLTANGWNEFKIGWYRKNTKMFGIHPCINLGWFFDNVYSELPEDYVYSSGVFAEPGVSFAFHYAFVTSRLTNSIKKYFDLENKRGYHHSYIYLVSLESGYYFHRFEASMELGLGYDLLRDFDFYGVYACIHFGLLLGKLKIPGF
ncbi:MAG TPA: hypothetical protein P5050_01945 [Bacteroidia bacterium]|nr:hypothetical protein [Bacteroidia bacterium]HRS57965.1 hypothetical protein [Bacteroidia bacterium]HRU68008.1 hypothetical protein [Bacteroidia bacterium]